MTYNPDIHHRHSIRLRNYDYSSAGAYFVTLCAQHRECLLGNIIDGEMKLNDAGRMIERWWLKLQTKFTTLQVDEYVIMPNHFHGIFFLVNPEPPEQQPGRQHRAAPTLGDAMDWFKTMTTNEYIRGVKQSGWQPFPGKLWQRNYYERVIRNDDELTRAREYIVNNPLKWDMDKENPVQFPSGMVT